MNESDEFEKIKRLTPREIEVLRLVCEHFTYREISKKIWISVSTIKTHMGNIYIKLGLDQLPRRARIFALGDVYCKALRDIDFIPDKDIDQEDEGKEIIPSPISNDLMEKVEEDDGGPIMILEGKGLEPYPFPDDEPQYKPVRRKFNPVMSAFMVIAIISILFTGYSIFNRFFGTPPAQPVSTPEKLAQSDEMEVNPTEVQSEPATVAQSSPTDTVQPTPKATARPKPAILFEDNFDQGLSDEWEVVSGNPYIVNGRLGSDRDTWLVVGDPNWKNYSIEYDTYNPYTSTIGYGFNVTALRMTDMNNMYAGKWTTMESQWFIVENGIWNEIPDSRKSFFWTDGINHRITVEGNLITVYINGMQHFSLVDTRYTQGRVGIMVHEDTQIDNFKIKEILE